MLEVWVYRHRKYWRLGIWQWIVLYSFPARIEAFFKMEAAGTTRSRKEPENAVGMLVNEVEECSGSLNDRMSEWR